MTKADMLRLLEPFDDDIRIVFSDLLDCVIAQHSVLPDGEGVIVLSDLYEDEEEEQR